MDYRGSVLMGGKYHRIHAVFETDDAELGIDLKRAVRTAVEETLRREMRLRRQQRRDVEHVAVLGYN